MKFKKTTNLQKELDENELRLKDSTSLSAEISKLESLYESANSSLITNKEEIQGLKSTIIEIKDSDTLESDITALKSQIDEAKDRNSEITKKLANFSELQSLEMELKESKGYYKNLKHELKEKLKEAESHHEESHKIEHEHKEKAKELEDEEAEHKAKDDEHSKDLEEAKTRERKHTKKKSKKKKGKNDD